MERLVTNGELSSQAAIELLELMAQSELSFNDLMASRSVAGSLGCGSKFGRGEEMQGLGLYRHTDRQSSPGVAPPVRLHTDIAL